MLNLCLHGVYDCGIASEGHRKGLDPTFAALIRSHLAAFKHYSVFGLKPVGSPAVAEPAGGPMVTDDEITAGPVIEAASGAGAPQPEEGA